jgi:hypothetical protein
MSQLAILSALASIKAQIATLEGLVTGVSKKASASALPPLPQSEDEGAAPAKKAKVKKQLSPERIAFLKSPEHIAKLKAGLAAHRAKKAAEKEAGGGEPDAEKHVSSGASDAGSMTSQKRRGPKKLSEMTPEELEAHKAKVAARKAKKAAEAAAEAATE